MCACLGASVCECSNSNLRGRSAAAHQRYASRPAEAAAAPSKTRSRAANARTRARKNIAIARRAANTADSHAVQTCISRDARGANAEREPTCLCYGRVNRRNTLGPSKLYKQTTARVACDTQVFCDSFVQVGGTQNRARNIEKECECMFR